MSECINIMSLVYFEETSDVVAAIAREKQIKSWSRKKKTELIEERNPLWCDLVHDWFGDVS